MLPILLPESGWNSDPRAWLGLWVLLLWISDDPVQACELAIRASKSCTGHKSNRIESRWRKCMKAAVVPAVSSSWQIRDVPQPQPGPGQVLVKMRASGICYTDVHQTLGHLPGQFPRILGHEPAGEIVAVAPDVTTRKVADRVGSAWIQSTCGRCEW